MRGQYGNDQIGIAERNDIVLLIDELGKITEWMQENVCNHIDLYEPTDKIGKTIPKTVHPTAFTMFIPSQDMVKAKKMPALCIQLDDGTEDLSTNESSINIKLFFAVWNPGRFVKCEDGIKCIPDAEGWKDVLRFMDKTQREIEKTIYIADMRVDRKIPITYEFYKTKDGIVDAWPYWYGQMSFTLKAGMAAVPVKSYQELL